MVVAGLQGDDGGRTGRQRAGRGERLGFGVCLALALVIALPDDLAAGIEQDAADRRVRARGAQAGCGQGDGAPHGGDLGG